MFTVLMLCKCGHPALAHRNDSDGRLNRGPCSSDVRRFFSQPGPGVVRSGDVVLTPEQAKLVLKAAQNKALKAPSFIEKFHKLLRRGFEIIGCNCQMHHTVELGQVNIIKPGGY